jgi:5-methylcytosine-specific restriction protein B
MLPALATVTTLPTVGSDARLLSFTLSPVENWAAIPANQYERFPPIAVDAQQHVTYEYEGREYQGTAILKVLNKGKPTLYFSLGDVLANHLRSSNGQLPVYASTGLASDGEHLTRIQLATNPRDLIGPPDPPVAGESTPNNLFLPVRPDWRDSTSLLGYYNPLTETYEWTDFLRFILQAAESYMVEDGLAWFVILDEMNLAHVEYYFADLLSIIESGRREDGFSHDPIRLTYPDTLVDNAPPRKIYLPPNLYIIGTVNMDETTHAFSPKVLDRAFTIELTDVNFMDYPPTSAHTGTDLSDDEKRRLLAAFTRNGTFAQVNKTEIAAAVDAHPQIRTWLSNLNTQLAEDRFHFGYRVFDEIAQFIHNADSNGMFDSWETAFDHAVFMKVLPKFNGSRARLLGPLTTLVAWAINPDAPDPGSVTGHLHSLQTDRATTLHSLVGSARFPRVAKRGLQMMIALEEDGFVSFG